MKAIILLLALLQDAPAITFPEPLKPEPAPVIEDAPKPTADTFSTDQLYLIQSDVALVVLASPAGVLQVTQQFGYLVRGIAAGTAELLVLPAGSADVMDLRRRILTVTAAQTTPPDDRPRPPADDVAAAFRQYEQEWREAQGELADRLDAGEITSEKAAADWFSVAGQEARKQAFLPLLRAESIVFGGEGWTAEKHARYIRRYASGSNGKSTPAN